MGAFADRWGCAPALACATARMPAVSGNVHWRVDLAMADLQQTLVEAVLMELDLGLNFLDVAATTADRLHARAAVKHANTALRTAERMVSGWSFAKNDADMINERHEQLIQHLRAITDLVRVPDRVTGDVESERPTRKR